MYNVWSKEEIDYLIQNWATRTVINIAASINRPLPAVMWKSMQLRKRGIGCFKEDRYYSPEWSEGEIEILTNNYGIKPNKEIGRLVGRTAMAVETRAKKLRLSVYNNFYSYKVLSYELNKSPSVLRKYVENGWLKAKRAHFSSVYGHKPMIILEEDIVRFLKVHYHRFDFKKIRHPYFQSIVREAYKRNHGNEYNGGSVKYPNIGHFPPLKLAMSY